MNSIQNRRFKMKWRLYAKQLLTYGVKLNGYWSMCYFFSYDLKYIGVFLLLQISLMYLKFVLVHVSCRHNLALVLCQLAYMQPGSHFIFM